MIVNALYIVCIWHICSTHQSPDWYDAASPVPKPLPAVDFPTVNTRPLHGHCFTLVNNETFSTVKHENIWGVPEIGAPPNHPFYGMFPYKPSIFGVPPCMETTICAFPRFGYSKFRVAFPSWTVQCLYVRKMKPAHLQLPRSLNNSGTFSHILS